MKKYASILTLLVFFTACSSTNVAKKSDSTKQANNRQENSQSSESAMVLPTEEKAFVDAITEFDKESIIAQLGEPAKADDVKIKGSDKVVASIWHYHYINTDANGKYYQTTELDFVEDKVVQVVFLNNNGAEEPNETDGQHYDIPKK